MDNLLQGVNLTSKSRIISKIIYIPYDVLLLWDEVQVRPIPYGTVLESEYIQNLLQDGIASGRHFPAHPFIPLLPIGRVKESRVYIR